MKTNLNIQENKFKKETFDVLFLEEKVKKYVRQNYPEDLEFLEPLTGELITLDYLIDPIIETRTGYPVYFTRSFNLETNNWIETIESMNFHLTFIIAGSLPSLFSYLGTTTNQEAYKKTIEQLTLTLDCFYDSRLNYNAHYSDLFFSPDFFYFKEEVRGFAGTKLIEYQLS